MKKLSIICLTGLLGLGLTSCNEDFGFADPQSNPQESILQASDITVTPLTQSVTLSDYLDSTENDSLLIPIATADVKEGAMPANTYLQGYVEVSPNEDFSNSITLTGVDPTESDTLFVSPSAFQTAYYENVTHSPKAKTLYVRSRFETVTDTTSVAQVGEPQYYDLGQISLTPLPKLTIQDSYYIVGDMLGWDKDHAVAFTHSETNVYDDPVFTVDFTTTADNQYWKIVPKSNYDGDFWADPGVVGVETDGDVATSGKLIDNGAKAGKIEKAGDYRMTINMEDMTYTITRLTRLFFVTGNPNGWTSSTKSNAFYPIDDDVTQSYTGYFKSSYDLKIWMSGEFGDWSKCYGTAVDNEKTATGTLINSNSQSFSSPDAGYYTLTVNFKTLAYQWTKLANQNPTEYSRVTISGDFNGWGDTEMQRATDDNGNVLDAHNWYILGLQITDATYGCKFKATPQGSTDANWLGGTQWSFGKADASIGGNIPDKVGTYDVYFNDITNQYLFVEK